ncbi:MAG: 3-phosphoshikimate 1-carboxyvinyltransferase, partial [Lachnospiraceae bacterium]|nr:3-phosphoshikimate 1-carboxyvinyltransferase [Lachnospiraceae bacterium]
RLTEESGGERNINKLRLEDILPECITFNIDQSSQFLSALLIAAGTLHQTMEIDVKGSHGLSYADLTVKMMEQFGIIVNKNAENGKLSFHLKGDAVYQAMDYVVEPDMSAASYFYALAAVLGVRMTVPGVCFPMLQGDTEFIKVLEKMGCTVEETDSRGLVVAGPADGMLEGGFVLDMSAFSDQALTLAAIAPYADAPVTITGIGHIRLQECDRIQAIVRNLTALGIETEEREDEVTIFPGVPKGCEIETYDDHRVAMAFALTGLRTKGVKILNPSCCKKTFGEYFEVLGQVLSDLQAINFTQ